MAEAPRQGKTPAGGIFVILANASTLRAETGGRHAQRKLASARRFR